MGEPATVLVTGASGYLAGYLIKLLLEEGVNKIRGTVRSLSKPEKIKPLKDLEPANVKYPLELVEADLTKTEGWVEAIRGCTYVYHMASPFPANSANLTPEQQQELIIKPAVDGTVNVLKACAEAGGVKRVVLTSSLVAVSSGVFGHPGKPKDYVYTEEDWSDVSVCTPYDVSKTKAEQAAWEFMESLKEDKKFELAVVNPAYVQGPLMSAASGGGTQRLCETILGGKMPGIPNVSFPIVDVRDVVAVHKAAMESPDAVGKRCLTYNQTVTFRELATILREEFKPQGYSVPSLPLPKIGMWVFKLFDATAKEVYDMWDKHLLYNNDRMKSLGVEPRQIKDTIIDTAYSLIELGILPKKPHYRGPARGKEDAEGRDEPSGSTQTESTETKKANENVEKNC